MQRVVEGGGGGEKGGGGNGLGLLTLETEVGGTGSIGGLASGTSGGTICELEDLQDSHSERGGSSSPLVGLPGGIPGLSSKKGSGANLKGLVRSTSLMPSVQSLSLLAATTTRIFADESESEEDSHNTSPARSKGSKERSCKEGKEEDSPLLKESITSIGKQQGSRIFDTNNDGESRLITNNTSMKRGNSKDSNSNEGASFKRANSRSPMPGSPKSRGKKFFLSEEESFNSIKGDATGGPSRTSPTAKSSKGKGFFANNEDTLKEASLNEEGGGLNKEKEGRGRNSDGRNRNEEGPGPEKGSGTKPEDPLEAPFPQQLVRSATLKVVERVVSLGLLTQQKGQRILLNKESLSSFSSMASLRKDTNSNWKNTSNTNGKQQSAAKRRQSLPASAHASATRTGFSPQPSVPLPGGIRPHSLTPIMMTRAPSFGAIGAIGRGGRKGTKEGKESLKEEAKVSTSATVSSSFQDMFIHPSSPSPS